MTMNELWRIVTDKRAYYLHPDGQVSELADLGSADLEWRSLTEALSDGSFDYPLAPPPQIVVDRPDCLISGRALTHVLKLSADVVFDYLRESLDDFESGDLSESWLWEVFPPRFRSRLTKYVCLKFVSLAPMVERRLTGSAVAHPVSVAEELLASWILEEAADGEELRTLFGDRLADGDLEDLESELSSLPDLVFPDEDFRYLYDDSMDGVDRSNAGELLGMASLAFEDWFEPFRQPGG